MGGGHTQAQHKRWFGRALAALYHTVDVGVEYEKALFVQRRKADKAKACILCVVWDFAFFFF